MIEMSIIILRRSVADVLIGAEGMRRTIMVLMAATILFALYASPAISQPSSEVPPEEVAFLEVTTPEALVGTPTGVCQELQRYMDCVSGKKADIVFVFDTTGSMGGEIDEMKSISKAFADNLASSGIDYRLGLTEFRDFNFDCGGSSPCGGSEDFPYKVYNGGVLTGSSATFKSWIDGLSLGWGGDEPESILAAMMHTATDQQWRGGDAAKIVVLITDAPVHPDGDCCNRERDTLGGVISDLAANGITVYAVGPDEDSIKKMAFETGGKFYLIRSGVNLRPILEDITGIISCSFDIVADLSCEEGVIEACVQLKGRDGLTIPYRAGYTDAWMFVTCSEEESRRYDLEYDLEREAYCAVVDPVCAGASGAFEVTVYGRVCGWSAVEQFPVECGTLGTYCPEPCLIVTTGVNQDVYNYGDAVYYNASVINNQDEKRRIAISYGYVDPTPETHVIGTFMPDIYPGDAYVFFADFKVLDTFYSGKYVFFVTATDVHNPDCSVSDAMQFWVVEQSRERELILAGGQPG
jgi:hypothetical protein